MKLDSEISKRFVRYLVFAGVIFGSTLAFWNFGSTRGWARLNELLPAAEVFVLTSVTAFNLIYFFVRMKEVHPTIALLVPLAFAFVPLVWFHSHSLFHYDFAPGGVVQGFFYFAAASTAINVAVYLYLKRAPIG